MKQLQLPTDFLRVSPIDLAGLVAGGSPSVTSWPAEIAGETDAGRSAAGALAVTISKEVSR